jgi:hypothetical protein
MASVDALWCQAALLQIPHVYVPDTLAGFARVVRPGGAIDLSLNEGDGRAGRPRDSTAHAGTPGIARTICGSSSRRSGSR